MPTDLASTLETSQKVLCELFVRTSFAGAEEMFGIIDDPIVLDGVPHKIRFFKSLTSHPLPGTQSTIAYTFFLATPEGGVKEQFVEEVNKQRAGAPCNEALIVSHFLRFVPGKKDFDELTEDLKNVLQRGLYEGKPYEFAFQQVCPTADWDMTLVFVEVNSVMRAAAE